MDSSFLLQKVSKKLHPFLKEYLQIAFNMEHVSKKESAFSITVPHCHTPFTNSFQLHTAWNCWIRENVTILAFR